MYIMEHVSGPFGRETSTHERMQAARRAAQNAQAREVQWATLWSKEHPHCACLMDPVHRSEKGVLPWLLVLDTPGGRIIYRLTAEMADSGLYDHLTRRKNDGKPADAKEGVLMALLSAIGPQQRAC